jgi:hypothetical protein
METHDFQINPNKRDFIPTIFELSTYFTCLVTPLTNRNNDRDVVMVSLKKKKKGDRGVQNLVHD